LIFNRGPAKDIACITLPILQKEGIETEKEALELESGRADGGLRDALRCLI